MSSAAAGAETPPVPLDDLRRGDGGLAGDSTSATALAKLHLAMQELRTYKIMPYLNRSIELLKANEPDKAGDFALKALEEDEKCGFAWRLLGIARETVGDFANAIRCYESALQLAPGDLDIANDVGRLALILGMHELSEKAFWQYWRARPDIPDGANNVACVLRDQHKFDEAIEVLKIAIGDHPECAILWNTLATVLIEQGDLPTAMTFFDEALRIDPGFSKALYNRGNCKLALLDFEGALQDNEASLKNVGIKSEICMVKMARSSIKLCMGMIGEGWDDYEVRLDSLFAGSPHFLTEDVPRWRVGDPLTGKRLLIMAEQGLGDEVLLANTIPDVIEAVGPEGKVSIVVEPRLVPLFQRSFPTADVTRESTFKYETHILKSASKVDLKQIDQWAPMGCFLNQYRRSIEAFPKRDRFLIADDKRVKHWKTLLAKASDKPKVGILWKSNLLKGARLKHFSPFEQWEPVLKVPGVTIVNLQYGDCDEELALAKEKFGVEIWNPPGIDLKADLDDLAALCCAMDLVLGFSNATTNIAGACGAPVWMIAGRSSWTRLGQSEGYVWYPQTRMFNSPSDGDWASTMSHIADELGKAF